MEGYLSNLDLDIWNIGKQCRSRSDDADQGLHCLLYLSEVKGKIKLS